MAYHYVTRTVRIPVEAKGCDIVNADGKVIATVETTFLAEAMAELINLGAQSALDYEAEYDASQHRTAALVLRPQTLDTQD